jgi:glycine/D-amino acid oxidase-like deaminating enzyme
MSTEQKHPREADIAIIGGGITGAALAWGLGRLGHRVLILDEDDRALRASRGNFALVWIQLKGLGLPDYAVWTHRAAEGWPALADALREQTGIDVAFQQPGGFVLALNDSEMEKQADAWRRQDAQPGIPPCPHERLDHQGLKTMLPDIGPEVVGGFYCPRDGHVNALRLLAALHRGLALSGAAYRPAHRVEKIIPQQSGFLLKGDWGEVACGKVVLAAGLGNASLAPMVGLHMPVRPVGGHVMVTEKVKPFLRYPMTSLRQTDEGSVMVGISHEERGVDTTVIPSVLATMADRAIRMFPLLGGANVVRSWSALRVMSPDGFPIYDQSPLHPGAFGLTCHSGITLAPCHAFHLAPLIAAGTLPAAPFHAFSGRRFHVPATA